MPEDITPRQADLLEAIIKEYIETSEAVGSANLVQKYGLDVSPATVRNEMAELASKGYLEQPHTSAGRVPSALGWRYYIANLLKPEDLPILQEVALKQWLWQERFEFPKLLRAAAQALAESTSVMSFVHTNDGQVFSAGASNLLGHNEFFDIEVMRGVLGILDRNEELATMVNRAPNDAEPHVFLGKEIEVASLSGCALVVAHFNTGKHQGVVAVLGPTRMAYAKVLPTVKQVSALLSDLSSAW